jgi:cytochrome c oxidase cbb3-type subunit 1
MGAPGGEERAAFADAMASLGALIGAGVGLVLLLGSRDAGMSFHGLLFMLAGLVAAAFILQRSFDGSEPPEAPSDYMDGPIRVATIAAVIWGIAGFVVGDIIAWQLAFPKLNLDLPWTSFRPAQAAAHLGRDFCLRR